MDANAGHADHISESWIALAWADHHAGACTCSVDFQKYRQRWYALHAEAMALLSE